MPQTCSRCSRANPADAQYCYYDGSLLGGPVASVATLPAGMQPFSQPFLLSSGSICRNFNELSRACQSEWEAMVELLRQGLVEQFLTRLGRHDLATAARDAARSADLHLGLDGLLAQFPGQHQVRPRLRVEPGEIHLQGMRVGEDRRGSVDLSNQGARLVIGSVRSDSLWLSPGEVAGRPEKIIQFPNRLALAFHVRGQHLRASPKPLEGRLTIATNGGEVTVLIRAEVAPHPFPEGVLAGACSPRQLADKARLAPRDAAKLFEKGAVAAWYRANGWTYPIQESTAWGVGVVQQFFRALGLPDTFEPLSRVAEPAVARFDTVPVPSPQTNVAPRQQRMTIFLSLLMVAVLALTLAGFWLWMTGLGD